MEGMNSDAMCKGSWYLGTACGKCKRCADEARTLIPRVVEQHKRQSEILSSLADELEQHRRLVSNPLLTLKAIRHTLDN